MNKMLIACDKTGKRITAEEATKKDNKGKIIEYYCPLCETKVFLKKGNKKIDHFSHKEQTEICKLNGLHGETIQHMYMKKIMKELIEQENKTLFSELEWKIGKLIADYYFEISDNKKTYKVAVEVVHKHYDINDFKYKNKYYQEKKVYVIWIFNMDYLQEKGKYKETVKFKPIMKEHQKLNRKYTYFLNIHNKKLYAVRIDKFKRNKKEFGYITQKIEKLKINKFIKNDYVLIAQPHVKKFWKSELPKRKNQLETKELPLIKTEEVIKSYAQLIIKINQKLLNKIKLLNQEELIIYKQNYEILMNKSINDKIDDLLYFFARQELITCSEVKKTLKQKEVYIKEQENENITFKDKTELNMPFNMYLESIDISTPKQKIKRKKPYPQNIKKVKLSKSKEYDEIETKETSEIIRQITSTITRNLNKKTKTSKEEDEIIKKTYHKLELISLGILRLTDEELVEEIKWDDLQLFVKKEILVIEDFNQLYKVYLKQKIK